MQSTENTPLLQSQGSQVNLTIESDRSTGNAPHPLQHQFSLRPVPVSFAWRNLTVRTKKKNPATLVHNVSGYIKPGELVAIMGASGAGKSTLLNALTFRNTKGLDVSGDRSLEVDGNGKIVTRENFASLSAYVQQDDLFVGTLTVLEQLEFYAALKMDKVDQETKRHRIKEVMQELGLERCKNTRIGVPGRKKGISGGEAKRLSVACEILTNPSLMFCDEPTSGLDSFMAQNLIELLKVQCDKGKGIMCTVHQPSSQVFELFDKLILMAQGRLAYVGPARDARAFIEMAGYPCPQNYNPADHILHTLAIVPGEEEHCREKINRICDDYDSSDSGGQLRDEVGKQMEVEVEIDARTLACGIPRGTQYKAGTLKQFKTLLWRGWTSSIREPAALWIRLIQIAFAAIVLGSFFFGNTLSMKHENVLNINTVLFMCLIALTFINMVSVANIFCAEIPIFVREQQNNMYRIDLYFITKQLAELPFFLITPLVFNFIFYWMVGLNPDFERFAVSTGLTILVTEVVVGFGYIISCASPNVKVALALGPATMIPPMLSGGSAPHIDKLPDWLMWNQYWSWFRYAYEVMVVNQWKDVGSNNSTKDAFANLPPPPDYPNGRVIIEDLGFKEDSVPFDVGMLVVLYVAFRVLAFVCLLIRTRKN